jgi:molecular chaperone GrpE (heat shock protein)
MTGTFVLLAIAAALVLGLLLHSGGSREGHSTRDRATLIKACLDVSDLLDSDALREQILDALAEVGVRPVVVAAGEPFDSSRHRAVGTVPTTDAAFHNLVAGTERAGFSDRGRRLRWPDVLVFDTNVEAAA